MAPAYAPLDTLVISASASVAAPALKLACATPAAAASATASASAIRASVVSTASVLLAQVTRATP